jgi:hypothetical protein
MWSDYSKMDIPSNTVKIPKYLQSRKDLINSGTKSKIFRKSSRSRSRKKSMPGPDLSKGRYDKNLEKTRSRKEIDDMLRKPPKAGLSNSEMNKYYYKNFSPTATKYRRLNPHEEGSKFSRSPRKSDPYMNATDFQPRMYSRSNSPYRSASPNRHQNYRDTSNYSVSPDKGSYQTTELIN